MSKSWFLMVILLILALPSVLHAVGMGGFGGGSTGAMVDKLHIQTKTVGKVVYSHRLHGTQCNKCHPKLFKKKRNNKLVSMEAMESGRSCGGCHNGRRAFSVKGDCVRCHADKVLYQDFTVNLPCPLPVSFFVLSLRA